MKIVVFFLLFSYVRPVVAQTTTVDIQLKELKKAYSNNDTNFFERIHNYDYVFVWNKSKMVHSDIPSTFFFQSNGLYLTRKSIRGEYWIEETIDGFKLKIYSNDYLEKSFVLTFLKKTNQTVKFNQTKKKRLTPLKNRKYTILDE